MRTAFAAKVTLVRPDKRLIVACTCNQPALDSPVGPHLYDYLTSTTKARVGAEHRENLSTPGARLS